MHRYAHINKWLFRHVHSKHHRNDVYLNVITTSFDTPADGLVSVGVPVGLIVLFACWTNSFWTLLILMHTIACIFVFGGCQGGLSGSLLAAEAGPQLC